MLNHFVYKKYCTPYILYFMIICGCFMATNLIWRLITDEFFHKPSFQTKWQPRVKVQRDLLYYNRVPKTGSENLGFILQQLSKLNNFTQSRSFTPKHRKLSKRNQEKHILGIINGPRPYSYHKHIYFINFEEFGHVNPIWISMIRNPVDKFVSRYYYNKNRRTFHELKRKNSSQVLGLTLSKWKRISADQCINLLMPECHLIPGKPHELTIPYFCGQEDDCFILGSRWAYNQAVHNVETWYQVLGVLELFQSTLQVLEALIPEFFQDVIPLYQSLGEPHKNSNRHQAISEKNRRRLETNLTLEIDFYNFAVQRLHSQFRDLRLASSSMA